jgi:DNA-binding response OmpR family regulator
MTRPPAALIIDDDPDIADLLRAILETSGFVVETRADGIEVLELELNFDVILLDLNMPVFDGERLTDYWQLTKPEILDRVIILSGYSGWTQGRPLATFATIGKPVVMDEVIRVVNACVAQHRNTCSDSEHAT